MTDHVESLVDAVRKVTISNPNFYDVKAALKAFDATADVRKAEREVVEHSVGLCLSFKRKNLTDIAKRRQDLFSSVESLIAARKAQAVEAGK